MRAVVGANARRLRESYGVSQDELARSARSFGLKWSRSKVASLERGEKAVDAAELLLLAAALGHACRHDVTAADLFEGDGDVQLVPDLAVSRVSLRRLLTGAAARFEIVDIAGGQERLATALDRLANDADRQRQLAGSRTLDSRIHDARGSEGDVERRAGHALGLASWEVTALAVGIWGCSLTDRRDHLLGERLADGATAATRQAVRGRITRELMVEMRQRLAEVT